MFLSCLWVNELLTYIYVWYRPVLRIRDVFPGSRIRIFFPSRIPDPKTASKERGEKIFCHTFLCRHKFHKIKNYFSFEVLKKKIWANFQRSLELFTQKIVLSSHKYGFGIRKKPIPDPGSRGQKGTGSRIRIHNTGTGSVADPGSHI
jgi:hypothetical protein